MYKKTPFFRKEEVPTYVIIVITSIVATLFFVAYGKFSIALVAGIILGGIQGAISCTDRWLGLAKGITFGFLGLIAVVILCVAIVAA